MLGSTVINIMSEFGLNINNCIGIATVMGVQLWYQQPKVQ